MNQNKSILIRKFVEKSQEKFPYLSLKRVRKYYNHLNCFDKYKFTQEMRRFLAGEKIEIKKEELKGGENGKG